MYLSVIVPAYNEEKILRNNILKYYSYLQKQNFNFEIIVVDDGSTDNTKKIIKKLNEEYANIKAIFKEKNQGKGSAVRDGLLRGKGKYLLFLDADNATSIDHLEKAWEPLKNKALVIGSRNKQDTKDAQQIKSQNIIKRTLGVSDNKLIKLFTGLKINDTQCGFKIFNRNAWQQIAPKMTINRWVFDVEILTIA